MVSGITYHQEGRLISRFPHLHHLTTSGEALTYIKGKGEEKDVAAATIAQLGIDGWELVGIGRDMQNECDVLYFKRPIP